MNFNLYLLNFFIIFVSAATADNDGTPLVFTVASAETEGYLRYIRSANFYDISVTTLGLGQPWLGGDMNSIGGGYKINLLREALKTYKGDSKKIVLFTDSYDVLFLSPLSTIVEKFKNSNASVLFGTEYYCWPDETLKTKYPILEGRGARFLNSGLFIGYASDLYELLKTPIKDEEDDQLYYTKAYLDENLRKKLNFKLDHTSILFQNLNGAESQVVLSFNPDNNEAYLQNNEFTTTPSIVHGNGPSKLSLNNFGNYLAGAFVNGVCKTITEDNLELNEKKLPVVMLGLFIERPTPFLEPYFEKILRLAYPKMNIDLFIHNSVPYHDETIKNFIKSHSKEYKSFKFVDYNDNYEETAARDLAVAQSIKKKSDYLFVVDSEVHLDNPQVLKSLMKINRPIIAPLLTRPEKVWSNFWGALSEQGYYARSNDYMDIVQWKIRGLWNVPFISLCYLIKSLAFPSVSYTLKDNDADMGLCWNLRKENIFMHVTNVEYFGHLIDNEFFDVKVERSDFYQLFTNRHDWEEKYIHNEYAKQLIEDFKPVQPCPDVYWFPIGTDQFCDDLIAIVENFGKWSDGSTSDKRLQGGYEAVPTRDIHMNQVGLEQVWLKFLQLYIRPLQEKVFLGYFHDPPKSLMNFVVRYKPDEQHSLRPHHDSSTYTINIALNHVGVDYEGGGCKFLRYLDTRYNCSVTDTKKGWMLMHPGRLTHFHEGLRVEKGTRYIMISFVDP